MSIFDEFNDEQPQGYRPGYGKAVSCVDPDSDEEVGGPGLEPKTMLAKAMLTSVRPHMMKFKDAREAVAWYKLESKPVFDCSQPEWYEWLQSRFWCANEYHWSYQTLMRAIKNEDKFRPWLGRHKNE